MELCKKYSIILFVVLFLVIFAVEAFTASWIEMPFDYAHAGKTPSRLPRPRGLKSGLTCTLSCNPSVEAFTASWIEI